MIVCSVTFQDTFCTLLSRTTTTHLEEREAELELQRLEKKDEPGEAASERWQQVLSCHMHKKFTSVCLQHVCLSDKGMFFLQELAGRVGGQRLQQQHSVHSRLRRGPVCRGHLHGHRGALRSPGQQTLDSEGEVRSSGSA